MTQWFSVHDSLPPEDMFVLVYTAVYGSYAIAKFTPVRGWLNVASEDLRSVTHWCDLDLPMPYELRNSYDEELGKKYSIQKRCGIFGTD
jgi:hypothetical protein